MNELFPSTGRRPEQDREWPEHVDPGLGLEAYRSRWETRAAQWRALELAESVFGGCVTTRLTGRTPRSTFRGLLHLQVPFAGLERHRALEALFLASAARDPVLARVPFVFVLSPAVC